MAWIELHQTLPQNKKTLRLMNLLKIKNAHAVGHLCMLWLWALDNAQDGDLSSFLDSEISLISGWNKKPQDFVSALIQAGFLDEDKQIHDWRDYAGRLIEKRKSDAERKRSIRKPSAQSPQGVRRTSEGQSADVAGNRTVPNRTVPNKELDLNNKPTLTPRKGFEEFWKAYPLKMGKQAAIKSWEKIKPDTALIEKIIQAVEDAKLSKQWQKDNGQYIPHPTTWLNQGRWDDEYETAKVDCPL